MRNLYAVLTIITIVMITSCKDQNDEPIASFTVSVETAKVGDTIFFQSTCLNASFFEWNFGDGASSTEKNPFHLYSTEGDYNISLKASNDVGADWTSKSITIMGPCWSELAKLLTSRNTHMTVLLNNKIYVGGGITTSREFEAYDIALNTWESKADLLVEREFVSGCALNGKIYFIGGWANNETFDLIEEYDPITNTWSTKSPMPTKRWGHASLAVNEKIYVIGGALDWPVSRLYSKIEIYDPTTDTWITTTCTGDNITLRWGFGACVFNDKIYLMGGTTAKNYPPAGISIQSLIDLEEYDPVMNVLTKKASMPTPRWGLIAETANGKIYAIGGGNVFVTTAFCRTVEEYNPLSDTWVTIGSMPKGIVASASCVKDDVIYIPGGGGFKAGDAYDCFYSYEPGCDVK